MRQKSPCTRDCPDRCPDPNCHMTCEKYLKYRRILDEDNEEKRVNNQVLSMMFAGVNKNMRKNVLHKKKKGL